MMEMEEELKPWGLERNTFLTVMHLSQLVGIFMPGLGFILPVVMWVCYKDRCEEIDRHGKVIVNWMISFLIYTLICVVLVLIVIGIFGLLVLVLLNVIFIVIGAVKASEGKLWPYPLSISFFQVWGPVKRTS
ncbi:DUF4870 domain-containing protein [Microbulbifer litoralis]|uniref:DUF4870 domain-containing protein n=1 Tax=Microbulbifer litoralis TaxID=2933965 RepID=UPI0020296D45|nr:DUF4870 domain-containing protein [Microbulbifer sp. GX H0434]